MKAKLLAAFLLTLSALAAQTPTQSLLTAASEQKDKTEALSVKTDALAKEVANTRTVLLLAALPTFSAIIMLLLKNRNDERIMRAQWEHEAREKEQQRKWDVEDRERAIAEREAASEKLVRIEKSLHTLLSREGERVNWLET